MQYSTHRCNKVVALGLRRARRWQCAASIRSRSAGVRLAAINIRNGCKIQPPRLTVRRTSGTSAWGGFGNVISRFGYSGGIADVRARDIFTGRAVDAIAFTAHSLQRSVTIYGAGSCMAGSNDTAVVNLLKWGHNHL